MIPLVKEIVNVKQLREISQGCHFCGTTTRWWHENTNNPVCRACAKIHRVAQLPDYGQLVRADKRRDRLAKKQAGNNRI